MSSTRSHSHRSVFVTERPLVHQNLALEAAPDWLDITMLESPDRETIVAALDGADFMISERSGVIDAEMIRSATNLQLIQRLGTRSHDIDLTAAEQAGVAVCCRTLATSMAVAEHTMALVLSLVKRLRDTTEETVSGHDWGDPALTDANSFVINWSQRQGITMLHGATVGIMGFGEIGTQLAMRLRAFGSDVVYHNPNRLPEALEREQGIRYASFEGLLGESDIVCMLVPSSDQTDGITSPDFLAAMKPGSILVSTGASTTLDEDAVAAAYKSGHLAGVATDGYQWEPVRADNPLLKLADDRRANVILTPHCALGNMILGVEFRAGDYLNIVNLVEGRPLQDRIV